MEEVKRRYMKAYAKQARRELGSYFRFYNDPRPHHALGYQTPAEVFYMALNHGGSVQRQLLLPVLPIILAGSPPVPGSVVEPPRYGSWAHRIQG